MTTTSANRLLQSECSACHTHVSIDLDNGVISARMPSNGVRGSKHVPAHTVTIDVESVTLDSDTEGMVLWVCPLCGYSDSDEFDLS